MVFLQFFAVAALVIFVSVKVADKAEWFEEHTPIKGIIVGIILAASTSLPELVSGITSVLIGQPDMAASSILGSNLFNFLIIASAAMAYIKFKPNHSVTNKTNKINLFLILIYIALVIDCIYSNHTGNNISFISDKLSIVTVFIVVIYFTAITYFNQGEDESDTEKILANKNDVLKQLVVTLVLVVILVCLSALLAEYADRIVKATGMSPSSVGAVLVGASTSLPEFVSAFTLVRNKKYDMAFSATLGSNLFNFLILGVLDLVYKGNIVSIFSASTDVLIYFGFLNAIVFYFLLKIKTDKLILLVLPYIISVALYITYLTCFF